MVDLTRRTFLAEAGIAGTLAATGLEAFLLGGCAFPTNTRQEKISFQGALANHHLRQAYLEQLVNSPYIDKVVYDHDKSKAIEMGTNPDDIEGAYASLSTTHYISSNGQRSNTFGMERKHTLYVFGKAFDRAETKIGNNTITTEPTEERLFSILGHEYVHAKDAYYGIDLGNGLIINNQNYPKMSREVKLFVLETRANIERLELDRKFPTGHPARNFSLHQFAKFLYDFHNNGKPPMNNPYVKHQMQQIVARTPEVLAVAGIQEFYRIVLK